MGACRTRALMPAPLSAVWDFLLTPENMHLWGPLTQPVTDLNRPMQAGDHFTQQRKDFFRSYSQVLLVEEIVPYNFLRLRDPSSKLQGAGIISVTAGEDKNTTWIEETVLYSLGTSQLANWLDRWLVGPALRPIIHYKTHKAFHRLQVIFREQQQGSAAIKGAHP